MMLKGVGEKKIQKGMGEGNEGGEGEEIAILFG